ncbi:helix-turn-helix domain-containing protein [Tsukamurella tyrosinosolvens]|uniref:helix-turn-helix domain-containing protein n=1 Tax=Tsukamurella tyrosinosolvens TaxID=57704 RepID=UPI002DD44D11|nr:helix-turn-helix domain-containing protein [Tsukamurella tyrosinosolvens]MEC4612901.1 helix-turn-helix domain-containing protein [Tsukamurella tyrosinosolvens]
MPIYLTATQVARILGCSASSVHRLARTGELTYIQVLGRRRFEQIAVHRYLSRCRHYAQLDDPDAYQDHPDGYGHDAVEVRRDDDQDVA